MLPAENVTLGTPIQDAASLQTLSDKLDQMTAQMAQNLVDLSTKIDVNSAKIDGLTNKVNSIEAQLRQNTNIVSSFFYSSLNSRV